MGRPSVYPGMAALGGSGYRPRSRNGGGAWIHGWPIKHHPPAGSSKWLWRRLLHLRPRKARDGLAVTCRMRHLSNISTWPLRIPAKPSRPLRSIWLRSRPTWGWRRKHCQAVVVSRGGRAGSQVRGGKASMSKHEPARRQPVRQVHGGYRHGWDGRPRADARGTGRRPVNYMRRCPPARGQPGRAC